MEAVAVPGVQHQVWLARATAPQPGEPPPEERSSNRARRERAEHSPASRESLHDDPHDRVRVAAMVAADSRAGGAVMCV